MNYKTFIQLEAVNDFEEAQLWYDEAKVKGLSERFSNAVKSTITAIQKHPTAYATRYKSVRVAHTDKFPYAIHFMIENDLIIIIAIIYSGRNPKLTSDRV